MTLSTGTAVAARPQQQRVGRFVFVYGAATGILAATQCGHHSVNTHGSFPNVGPGMPFLIISFTNPDLNT